VDVQHIEGSDDCQENNENEDMLDDLVESLHVHDCLPSQKDLVVTTAHCTVYSLRPNDVCRSAVGVEDFVRTVARVDEICLDSQQFQVGFVFNEVLFQLFQEVWHELFLHPQD